MSTLKGSPLSKARGLGSAKHGTGHFVAQRVSAVGLLLLIPLMSYLVLHLIGVPFAEASNMLARPGWALVAGLFVITSFYHASLGLQVVIEDYVGSEGLRFLLILLVRFGLVALGGFALIGLITNLTN